MKPQTKSLLEWFIVANLTVIFLGSILIVWLMFFQGSNPMVVRGDAQALPTVQPELDETGNFIPKNTFYSGEQLTFGIDFCKNIDVEGKMYGTYVDGVKIDMPVVEVKTQSLGCHRRIASNYIVSAILPSGEYHFEVDVAYKVNPLRTVHVKYQTQKFNIIQVKK